MRTEDLAAGLDAKPAAANGAKPGAPTVSFDAKGKLTLPAVPAIDDRAGQCAWLTAVFSLDARHPVTGGAREGLRGALGHVVLYRADAQPLRFEPASRINQPPRLIEDLSWQTLRSDGAVHALKGEHARLVAHVVRMLTDAAQALDEEAQTRGIVATFLADAQAVEGHTTYGTTAQRYEAADALQRDLDDHTGRPMGPTRYIVDANTGELAIRVSDLGEAGRRHRGSSLAAGWLDARMEALGWARVELQGYAQPGRAGRTGPHARCNVYRGHLPAIDADDSAGTVPRSEAEDTGGQHDPDQ
jgi:hypothetical protein